MKNLLLLLPLIVVPCVAQPKSAAPQIVVSPEAKIALDRAAATCLAAQSNRLKVVEREDGEETVHNISFQKPNLIRVETRDSEGNYRPMAWS